MQHFVCASDWLKTSRTSGVPIGIPVGMGVYIDIPVGSRPTLVLGLLVFIHYIKGANVNDSQKLLTPSHKLMFCGPCFDINFLSVANLSSSTALNVQS